MASIVGTLGAALSSAGGAVGSAASTVGSAAMASPWQAAQVGLLGAGTGLGLMGQVSAARQADIEGARQREILAREVSRTMGEQVAGYGVAGVDPNTGSPMQIAETTYSAQQRMNEDLVRATELARRSALLRAVGISALGVGSMIGPMREILQQQAPTQTGLSDLSPLTSPSQPSLSLMGQGEFLLPPPSQLSIANVPPLWNPPNASGSYSLLGGLSYPFLRRLP